LENLKAT